MVRPSASVTRWATSSSCRGRPAGVASARYRAPRSRVTWTKSLKCPACSEASCRLSTNAEQLARLRVEISRPQAAQGADDAGGDQRRGRAAALRGRAWPAWRSRCRGPARRTTPQRRQKRNGAGMKAASGALVGTCRMAVTSTSHRLGQVLHPRGIDGQPGLAVVGRARTSGSRASSSACSSVVRPRAGRSLT